MGYFVAVGGTVLATVLRWMLGDAFHSPISPYITFYPVVILSALVGGIGPGILATVLTAIFADWFFLAPIGHLWPAYRADMVSLGLFCFINLAMSVVGDRLRAARLHIGASARRAEAQARDLEQVLQLLDLTNVFVCDMDSRIVRWNAGCQRLFGYTSQQALGQVCRTLLHTRLPQPLEEIRATLLQTGRWTGELGQTTADGREITVASQWVLWRDPAGMPSAILRTETDISDRKRMEEALQDSERRYRLLFDRNPDGVFTLDAAGHITMANPACETISGYPVPELVRKTFMEICAPDQLTKALEYFQRCLREARYQELEAALVRKDGRRVELWVAGEPIVSEGKVVAIHCTAKDVTEHNRTREALRQSEEKFRVLAENVDVSFGIVQGERFVYANPCFARMSGYSVDELLTMTFSQLVHPDFQPMMSERARRRQAGEPVPGHYEFAMITKDGRKRWVDFSVSTIEYQGKPAIIGTGADITERKQAEEALRRSEEQRRLAMKAARMGSWKLNLIGQTCSMDEPCRAIWGRPDSEVITFEQMYAWIHPEDRQGVADAIARTADPDSTGIAEREFRILWPDGRIRWLRAAGHALFDEHDGRERAFEGVGVTVDITDQKRAEQELKDLNEHLEHLVAQRTATAQRRAEQLRSLAMDLTQTEQRERERLSRILHDHLQQLLVGIKFNVATLRNNLKGTNAGAMLDHLYGLADESIRMSRSLAVDLSPPILHKGTMSQVLAWLADWVREKHGLAVRLNVDEAAGPANPEIRVLLFQAIRELLLNVAKYADVDAAEVELGRIDDQQVKVVVRDQGVGFDPARLQAGQSKEGGFGLFSIQERLESLGGSVDIHSAPGLGTRITLLVPAGASQPAAHEPDQRPAAVAPDAAAPGHAVAAPGRNIRVLLADDHQVLRDGLARILEDEPGIEVAGQASNGLEAVQLVRQLHPDVVLMDVNMPGLDGIHATREIVQEQPHTCVIGLSMYAETGVSQAMEAAGAVRYMTKSSSPDTIVTAVRECRRPASERSSTSG